MGPNGSGKSTLAYVLSGPRGLRGDRRSRDVRRPGPAGDGAGGARRRRRVPGVPVSGGTAGRRQRELPAHRAECAAPRARRERTGRGAVPQAGARARRSGWRCRTTCCRRNVNVGFSGGEKKRNEVLQMAILRPKLAILDETDSGLDIDALKIVADGVNALRGPDFSALVITHYQRLLDHIVPDRVHVLAGGRIVRSGGPELAHELEAQGLRRHDRGGGVMRCRRRIVMAGLTGHARSLRRIAPLVAVAAGGHDGWSSVMTAPSPPAPTASSRATRPARPPAGRSAPRDAAADAFRRVRPARPARRSVEIHRPAPARRRRVPGTADAAMRIAAICSRALPQLDAPRLVFVDGRFRADLSDAAAARSFARFADRPDFGALAQPGPRTAGRAEHHAGGRRRGHRRAGGRRCRPDASGQPGHRLADAERLPSAPRHPPRRRRAADPAGSRRSATAPICTTRSPRSHVAEGATLTHIRLQNEVAAAFHLSTLYAEIAGSGTYDSFTLNLGARMARTEIHARLDRPRRDRASERRAASDRHAACRLHHRRAARRAARHVAPDGEERAGRTLARRVPGPHRSRARRAEDRRLPDEPGAAAVARRRDRHQAGAGNLRRRREVQPRRHGRRTGRRAAVLSAQPRHSGRRGARRCWCAPSWPRRWKPSRTTRRAPCWKQRSRAGGRGRRA